MDLFGLIDELQSLLERKEHLENEEKSNNKGIDRVKKELSAAMIDNECPRVSRGDYTYTLQSKVKYNKIGGMDERLFDILRENGLGDIIKETVNAQTLTSTIKSIVEEQGLEPEEVPEDFIEVIVPYQFYDIARRRESNKNAKKKAV